MRHFWLLTSLIILFSTPALAQKTVKIGGTVTDENGNPIELATIRLEGTAIGTVSNLKGRYSLKFESRDSVTVIFSMLGYQTRKRKLVRPQGNISLNIILPPMNFELGEVSVTERRRQTGTIQQIETKQNRLVPDASGGSIEAVIATQAGVSSNNELSSQYNVRGGSFDENMVYVNGIEIYRPLLIRSGPVKRCNTADDRRIIAIQSITMKLNKIRKQLPNIIFSHRSVLFPRFLHTVPSRCFLSRFWCCQRPLHVSIPQSQHFRGNFDYVHHILLSSPSRARTYNTTVNSRVLYH